MTDQSLNFLWLELTQKCNLFCQHCYNNSSPEMPLASLMREEDWKAAISQGVVKGAREVQFIGGEPLLVKYIDRLIAFARQKSLRVEVFTNATSVTQRHIDFFKRYDVSVATSFYSFDARVHDRITGKQGSWERSVAALQMMVSGELPLRVGMIRMAENHDHVNRTRDFLISLGVTNFGLDDERAFGRASTRQSSDSNYFEELCGRCGTDRICITGSGDIFPCIMSRSSPIGNFLETGLDLRQSELRNFENLLNEAKGRVILDSACTPDCFPHGGCAPHDLCNPHKKLEADMVSSACTPDCWPHGGCAPHDVCNPHKKVTDAKGHRQHAM